MKRIGLPERHRSVPIGSSLARDATRDRVYDSDLETMRRKRVKVAGDGVETTELHGKPMSGAQVTSLYMQAKGLSWTRQSLSRQID
jgi:hypothetical protein